MSQVVNKKQISFSDEILKSAQKKADMYFNGNLSAYLSHLVLSARDCECCRIEKRQNQDISQTSFGKIIHQK